MRIKPVNRYIQIELRKQEENVTASGIVLPDDYEPVVERYVVVKVMCAATDVRFNLPRGTQILIDQTMIEEITVNNKQIAVVQDNYVIGIL